MSLSRSERQGSGGGGSGGGGVNTSAVLGLIRDNANKMTIGDSFPADPLEGALNYFVSDNITGLDWKDSDETTDRTTPAYQGNVARYNGTDWVFFYNFRNLIEALARSAVPMGNADGGITIGASFPTGVSSGHVHLLTTDNTSISFVNTSDEAVTAMAGDFTHYDGTKWVLLFRFKSLITASTAAGLTARNVATTFPTSPQVGEVFILLADIPSGIAYKNDVRDGASDVIRSAKRGQVFEYQAGVGSLPNFWVIQGNINPPPIIPFEPQALSGSWTRFASSTIGNNAGVFYADSNEVVIQNNGNRARLLAIQPNHGIVFEDHGNDARTIFIVSAVDASDNRWVEYQGRWASKREVATAVGNDVSIYHIPHSLNITPFIDTSQLGLREASFGLSLPSEPRLNESFVFLEATSSDPTWVDITGSPQGAALQGDVAQFVIFNNSPQWLYLGNVGGGGGIDTSALDTLRTELEAQIAAISTPVYTYELWSKSKHTLAGRWEPGNAVDLDWTLEDGVSSELAVDGDFFVMPLHYRGQLALEVWNPTTNTLLDRALIDVSTQQQDTGISNVSINGATIGNFSWILDTSINSSGTQIHRVYVVATNANQGMLAGLEFRIYAEVAISASDIQRDIDLISSKVDMNETDIDALESSVANLPVSTDVLWATSKAIPATLGPGTGDTDWTKGGDAPDGVVADGDFLNIPNSFRGDIHLDVENSAGEITHRVVIPIDTGRTEGFGSPFPNQIGFIVEAHPTDGTLFRLSINVRGSNSRDTDSATGGVFKIYGVSALPRNQIAGITQQQLDAALAALDVLYIDPNRRYATTADLSKNWVFFFSHVPERYKNANLVSISWDGVIAYRNAWTPSTEYIFFAIDPAQINNLIDNANTDTSKLIWRVQVTFLQGTTTLGIEDVPIIIDRG